MTKTGVKAVLATTTILFGVGPALAQNADASLAAEISAMRAKIESLEAEVATLKAQAPAASAMPTWKGAPQLEDKEKGWSFKPRGRLQVDAGYVAAPDGLADPGLGFATEVRRARIGVEGNIPGGFGYKFEADLAENDVEIADAILTYDFAKNAGFAVGHHNNFQSLEELTSSRFTSFIERAAFTDAFNFERRVGVSGSFSSGDLTLNAGVFSDNINDLGSDRNGSISIDGRAVYAPKIGSAQLHFGGSAHHRDLGDITEQDMVVRYRQRPLVHTTDVRFLATPALSVEEETDYGLEAAAIAGPLHVAAEAHWMQAQLADGTGDPTFFGGYAEVGYYLTGETRGYKNGVFDRTKVLRPVGQGGLGALQFNLRYDYADLNDAGITGGKQSGYLASLIWIPQDYVRFMLNYGRLEYEDAARLTDAGQRNYGVDVIGARAQVDF